MHELFLAEKDTCTGCGACVASCSVAAIRFCADKDGFQFPLVDYAKCIRCGRCAEVCKKTMTPSAVTADERFPPRFYAVQALDEHVLESVSSGGAFWALAAETIQSGGVVYGVVQDGVDVVSHHRAHSIAAAIPMRRSKYLPSEAWRCYGEVRKDLEASREVLFTGTGCQIAGLLAFLGGSPAGLTTAEVVCHGLPTSAVWRGYLRSCEKRMGSPVKEVVFRDKTFGWKNPAYRIAAADGKVIKESIKDNPYHSAYLKGLFYRKSCSTCRFAGFPRVADLSLADFWKYEGASLDRTKGISLVSVNTVGGRRLFDRACRGFAVEPVSRERAELSCRHLTLPPKESRNRESFLKLFQEKGFDVAVGKYAVKSRKGIISRIRARVLKAMRGFMPFKESDVETSRHAAMADAFILLAKKGVPVYFCNRVGLLKDKGWSYGLRARRRISRKLGFPEMAADVSGYEQDLRDIYGERYSEEYIEGLSRIPQVVEIGGICRHEDARGKYVNVVGGHRVTAGQPEKWARTLYVYGRCGAFGYAVEDSQTLPSQLQMRLLADFPDLRVVNRGLWGGDDACVDGNFLHDVMEMKSGDAVLFYRRHPDMRLIRRWQKLGVRYRDITAEWHKLPEATDCFFDKPGHMNASGYAHAAMIVADWLKETGMSSGRVPCRRGFAAVNLNSWLKENSGSDDGDLERYVQRIRADVDPLPEGAIAGAIVMNCNPFTKGHRYLIETAAREVDRLYIFVVEEDRSFFRFADRYEMVVNGVVDIPNVIVKPSGRFIISALTFPQYFMKDYVKEKGFDASSDVLTFCEKIAPALGISVRFAGEEPFDPVTENYNRCMENLLPRHGIRFREIPRLAVDGCAVNVTEVRRLLSLRDWASLAELVPVSTLEVLKERYGSEDRS